MTVKLGDICELMTGGTPSRAHPEYFKNGTIKWLVSGDIHKQEIHDCDGRITETALKSSNARILPVDSVMIALNGQGKTRASVAMLRTVATCNQSLVCIFPKDRNKVLPEWVYWNLKGRYHELRRITGDSGNDRRGLNMIIIRNINLPTPPSMEEQRQIVAKFDAAFEKIGKAVHLTEQNILNMRMLYESSFQAFIGKVPGVEVALSEVCDIDSKLIDPREEAYLDRLHIGAANIETGTGKLHSLKTAQEEKLISGKFPFDEHTVLYSKIRPYLMKVARPNFAGVCSADVYPLFARSNIDKNYLFYLLLSPNFTQYAISGSDRAGMPKVNRDHMFAYSFNLPDKPHQIDVVRKLDSLLELKISMIDRYSKKLEYLRALKQSVLKETFSESAVK